MTRVRGAGAKTMPQEFAALPRAVQARRHYPPCDNEKRQTNRMWNKRVVRGSAVAAINRLKIEEEKEIERQKEFLKRKLIKAQRAAITTGEVSSALGRDRTPSPVSGRAHIDAQTDEYVEVLQDHQYMEADALTQTEFVPDRPSSPLFMPASIGVDVAVQIEDGDLFCFDEEVEPMLEVLIAKTLEQSFNEVVEEEEMRCIQEQQEEFERMRNVELAEVQRLQALEQRRLEENQRRKTQAAAASAFARKSEQKFQALKLAKTLLRPLEDRSLSSLESSGAFEDPTEAAICADCVPLVASELVKRISLSQKLVPALIQHMLSGVVQREQELRRSQNVQSEEMAQSERLRKMRTIEEEAERRKKKREEEEIRRADKEERRKRKAAVAAEEEAGENKNSNTDEGRGEDAEEEQDEDE